MNVNVAYFFMTTIMEMRYNTYVFIYFLRRVTDKNKFKSFKCWQRFLSVFVNTLLGTALQCSPLPVFHVLFFTSVAAPLTLSALLFLYVQVVMSSCVGLSSRMTYIPLCRVGRDYWNDRLHWGVLHK